MYGRGYDPNHPLNEFRAEKDRQVAANKAAKARGEPLPYPNMWDALDPTKVPEGATPEEITARYRAFQKICRPPECKRHTI